jgi:hypothetical protein
MLKETLKRVQDFTKEAHTILSFDETSLSRVFILGHTYQNLAKLSSQQDELLKQALLCVENNLFRPAHILAWTALIDMIENILNSDNFKKLKSVRTKWKVSCIDDLRDNYAEYQIIEACKDLKLTTKSEMKMIHGFLGKRNLCSHPSEYNPDFNQTLGYIADILSTMKLLQLRPYP